MKIIIFLNIAIFVLFVSPNNSYGGRLSSCLSSILLGRKHAKSNASAIKLEVKKMAPKRFSSIKFFSGSKDSRVAIIVRNIKEIFGDIEEFGPKFDPSTFSSSRGKCGTYCTYIEFASKKIGDLKLRYITSENGHVHLKPIKFDDIIIDPSIRQFIDHPEIGDVFIGTVSELRSFVMKHPDSIVGTSSSGNPKEALRRIWGINTSP